MTSPKLRFEDIRNESRLPRVANPSFWSSLVPKFVRRRTSAEEAAERATAKAAKPKQWNPYTTFIILGVLVGSNAIQLIALRNEMLNYSRKTDAKLALLREVVQRVKNGEDIDVKRLLGTGDPEAEKEWEEAMQELESTDMLWEGKQKKEAKKVAKAEQRRLKDEEKVVARERETVSPTGADSPVEPVNERRPKFLM